MSRNFLTMKSTRLSFFVVAFSFCSALSVANAGPLFHSSDPLAARDQWGLLHQTSALEPTDFSPRYRLRFLYYLESRHDLATKPAYVGAVQSALRRLGYYCGESDGIFTDEVSEAIARLQKNYSMRVTGTLTVAVRRALFLP